MYPLPSDYHVLTEDGKKRARVNACCIGNGGTPTEFVVAWDTFRRMYLFPTGPDFFYGSDLVESPQFHYELIWSLAAYQNNVWACPRGFGKSTVMDEVQLLLSLTRPGFPMLFLLATDDLVGERMEIFQKQFSQNEFIIADFGMLKPSKGEGKFNEHTLSLVNGSRLRGRAVLSRKRGLKPRPRLLILDDPEYDPKAATDMSKLRQEFESLLFSVLLNMGEKGMCIMWPGTMISKKGMLYFAINGDDPRFVSNWNRRLVKDTTPAGDDGKEVPTWKEMMNEEEIQKKIDAIGWASYAREYRNEPGENQETTFSIHPDLNTYTTDGDVSTDPLRSIAVLTHHVKAKGTGDIRVVSSVFGDFVGKMTRLMLMDYASTAGVHSDYSSIVVVGFEPVYDVLWVLDCWAGKVREDTLVRKLYQMGKLWMPRVVGIEAVSVQKRVVDMAAEFIEARSTEGGWNPRVFPIRYAANMSKQDRIGGMAWRFNSFKIKLPVHLRNASPHWRMLLEQIENFQAEAMDGNLQHDDMIDALSMYQEIHRSSSGSMENIDQRAITPLDKLASGELIDHRTGIPVITGLNASEIPLEVAMKLLSGALDAEANRRSLGMRFTKPLVTVSR